MRYLLIIVLLVLAGSAAACSDGGGNTGGGGAGGSCDLAACDPGGDCQVATCTDGGCGLADAPDGTACGVNGGLQCKAGKCQGCSSAEQCTPADCNDTLCTDGVCELAPNGELLCADGAGTCDDQGKCGKCDDGVKNGDETGVDCGEGTVCGKCAAAPCADGAECASGSCQEGICCDAPCDGACLACTQTLTGEPDGVCAPLLDQSSAPECSSEGGCGEVPGYCKCADGIQNGDETDVDCGGVCGSTCGNGSICADGGDCVSGNCVGGLCCNESCGGACEACDTADHLGLCLPVAPGQPHASCQGTSVCGVSGACAKPTGEPCAQDGECASNLCNGSPAVCAACTVSTDCEGDAACVEGGCFAKVDKGAPCLGAEGCTTGFCVDGVCCESACNGLCMSCHFNLTAISSGECDPIVGPEQGFNGFYDPHGECAPAPGGGAYCSGAPPDAEGNSTCGGTP